MINSSPIGVKPASSIAATINSDSMWFKLTEGTGATISDTLGNVATDTMSGTDGAEWTDNPTWLTPDNAQFVQMLTTDALDVCRLDDAQQMLIAFDLNIIDASATTGNNYIMSYGRTSSNVADGGWSILQLAQATAVCKFRFDMKIDGTITGAVSGATSDGLAVGKHHILVDLDLSGTDPVATLYLDGITGATKTFDTIGSNRVGRETTGAYVLMARYGGSGISERMGATANSINAIRNLLIYKNKTTYSATLAADVAVEMSAKSLDLPWALENK